MTAQEKREKRKYTLQKKYSGIALFYSSWIFVAALW